jgi:hypothetical protein
LDDVPAVQIIREMQPDAKFIITLSDPVKRMYSDYYFLGDNLMPVRPGTRHNKSAEEFHWRVVSQVEQFNACIKSYSATIRNENPSLIPKFSDRVFARNDSELGQAKAYFKKAITESTVIKPSDPSFPLWFRSAQMYV